MYCFSFFSENQFLGIELFSLERCVVHLLEVSELESSSSLASIMNMKSELHACILHTQCIFPKTNKHIHLYSYFLFHKIIARFFNSNLTFFNSNLTFFPDLSFFTILSHFSEKKYSVIMTSRFAQVDIFKLALFFLSDTKYAPFPFLMSSI